MEYTFKYKNLPRLIKSILKSVLKKLKTQAKPLLAYNRYSAIEIKKSVNIPVIVVGGINNVDDIQDMIEHDNINYVSMCRPFIIEPNIVNKFLKGKQTISKCIMCNYCVIIGEEQPLKCYYGKLPQINRS